MGQFQPEPNSAQPRYRKDALEQYFELTTPFFAKHWALLQREHVAKVFGAVVNRAYYKTFSSEEKECFQFVCTAFYTNLKKNYQAEVLSCYQSFVKTILLKTQARNLSLAKYMANFLQMALFHIAQLSRDDLMVSYAEAVQLVRDKYFLDNIADLDFMLIILGQQNLLKAILPLASVLGNGTPAKRN